MSSSAIVALRVLPGFLLQPVNLVFLLGAILLWVGAQHYYTGGRRHERIVMEDTYGLLKSIIIGCFTIFNYIYVVIEASLHTLATIVLWFIVVVYELLSACFSAPGTTFVLQQGNTSGAQMKQEQEETSTPGLTANNAGLSTPMSSDPLAPSSGGTRCKGQTRSSTLCHRSVRHTRQNIGYCHQHTDQATAYNKEESE